MTRLLRAVGFIAALLLFALIAYGVLYFLVGPPFGPGSLLIDGPQVEAIA
jgi:hypothetical protein